jgi:hypothetical protein
MRQVDQDFEALANDLVALFSTNTSHQSHATSVVLVAWVIEPLGAGYTKTAIR